MDTPDLVDFQLVDCTQDVILQGSCNDLLVTVECVEDVCLVKGGSFSNFC